MALHSLLDTRQGRKVRTGLWNRNFDLGTRFKLRRVLFQSEGRTLNDEERRVVAFFVQHTQMAKTPYWTVLSTAQRARLADLVQLSDVMVSADSVSGASESGDSPEEEQGQGQDPGRGRAASTSSRSSSTSGRGGRVATTSESASASAPASAPFDFQRCVALYGAAVTQVDGDPVAAAAGGATTSVSAAATDAGAGNDPGAGSGVGENHAYIQLGPSRLARQVFIMVKGHGWAKSRPRNRARTAHSSSQDSAGGVEPGDNADDAGTARDDVERVALNPGDIFGALDVPGVQPSTAGERRALDGAARFSGGVVLEAGCQLLAFTSERVHSIFEEARAARLNNRRLIRGKDWRDTLVANFFPDALRHDMLAPATETSTNTAGADATAGGSDRDDTMAGNFFRNALPARPRWSPSAASARSPTPVTSPASPAAGDANASASSPPGRGLGDDSAAADIVCGTPLGPLDADALWRDVSVASSRAARGDPFAVRPPSSQTYNRERDNDKYVWDVNAQRVSEAHERTSNIPFQLHIRDGTQGTFAMDFSTPAGSPELLRFETGVFQMMQGGDMSEYS